MLNKHELKSLALNGTMALAAILGFTYYGGDNNPWNAASTLVFLYCWFSFTISLIMAAVYNFLKTDPSTLSDEHKQIQREQLAKIMSGVSRKKYSETFMILDLIVDGVIAVTMAMTGFVGTAIAFTIHIYLMNRVATAIRRYEAHLAAKEQEESS